jgi:Leucine-rich repeat (LRR) protein
MSYSSIRTALWATLIVSIILLTGCSSSPTSSAQSGPVIEVVVINGTAYYKDGTAAGGALVALQSAENSRNVIATVFTDDNGRYRIDSIPRGSYLMKISDNENRLSLSQITVEGSEESVDIGGDTLLQAGTITGVIEPITIPARITLQYNNLYVTYANTDAAGAFMLSNVAPMIPPNSYTLIIESLYSGYYSLSYSISIAPGETLVVKESLPLLSTVYEHPHYIADSTVVREILDANNLQAVAVHEVSNIDSSYHIAELLLAGKNISVVPSRIGELSSLTTLDLSRNHLDTLPKEIGLLYRMRHLYIDYNNLTRIPEEIQGCINLRTLRARFNTLRLLPAQLGSCVNLTELVLDDNLLPILPRELGALENLVTLRVAFNNLIALPAEIGQCRSLRSLSLEDNKLSTLPPEIGHCTQLVGINLRNNRIAYLPPEIGMLQNLDMLWLSDNLLTELPRQIGNLGMLKKLFVAKNSLTALPEHIGNCTSLVQLDLSSNRLAALPATIVDLDNIEEINVENNNLCTLPSPTVEWLNTFDLNWRSTQHCAGSITIHSPNGGERYTVGDTLTVEWDAQKSITAVVVFISIDRGRHWILISSDKVLFPQNETWKPFRWEIPDSLYDVAQAKNVSTVSSFCLVRVADYYGSLSGPGYIDYYADKSDDVFAIEP